MSDRPERVRVGPFVFNIVWSQADLMKFCRSDGQDRFGQTHLDTHDIYIDDSRPLVALQNTLMHEILHALNWTYNIPTPANEGEDAEEQFVCRMDTPLLLLLKDNPEVFAWLALKTEDADA